MQAPAAAAVGIGLELEVIYLLGFDGDELEGGRGTAAGPVFGWDLIGLEGLAGRGPVEGGSGLIGEVLPYLFINRIDLGDGHDAKLLAAAREPEGQLAEGKGLDVFGFFAAAVGGDEKLIAVQAADDIADMRRAIGIGGGHGGDEGLILPLVGDGLEENTEPLGHG